MKLFWNKTELEEKFVLTEAEINLLSKRSNANKFGVAVLMKYVQHKRKYPSEKKEIPLDLVKYIANKLNISAEEYRYYKLDLRNSEYRKQRYIIRKYYSLKVRTKNTSVYIANKYNSYIFRWLGGECYSLPI